MWNNITNSLLQKKHIKIPIEKRFFLSFIEDDENNIQKNKIIEVLNKYGFYEDDPRLSKFFNNLKLIIKGNNIQYEEFKYCVENHICILKKILTQDCIIPRFNEFCDEIKTIHVKLFIKPLEIISLLFLPNLTILHLPNISVKIKSCVFLLG